MKKFNLFLVLMLTANLTLAAAANLQKPSLIVQITIDQLRADLPTRLMSRFGDGGFRHLYENGTVYMNAHHSHANNETIVGHTTLATGATPADHGMIGNNWLDRATAEIVYNIEDAKVRLLTAGADVDKSTEIDPTQKVARSEGRSPAAILASTFSDELAATTNGQAKIFGVSVKDRGAVSMAGHAGKAFWFSKATGEFVTSTYYMDQYPEWVLQWNRTKPTKRYSGASWKLINDKDTYLFGSSDDRPWEADLAGFKRIFPHPWGSMEGKYFTTLLTASPAGDELTLEFAKLLIAEEELGQDEVPDYLAVSFSSTDYVGHLFGPSSLEAEDNLLRLDRTLSSLLAHIDKLVGLDKTLIVLSSDHGAPDTPGYSNSLGIPAGYVNPDNWNREEAIERLKKKYRLQGNVIERYAHPYIYLSQEVRSLALATREAIEQEIASELNRFPNVTAAISSRSLEHDNLPDSPLIRAVKNNFNPKRSGDIYIVFAPNWFINDFDGLKVASTHGSPWRYDTHVPVLFSGLGITPQKIYRQVKTVDVATTLAAILQTKIPSAASGEVLYEVLEH